MDPETVSAIWKVGGVGALLVATISAAARAMWNAAVVREQRIAAEAAAREEAARVEREAAAREAALREARMSAALDAQTKAYAELIEKAATVIANNTNAAQENTASNRSIVETNRQICQVMRERPCLGYDQTPPMGNRTQLPRVGIPRANPG